MRGGPARRHRQTELQVRAAVDIGTTCLCRHARFPQVILDRADDGRGAVLHQGRGGRRRAVPSLRQMYADRGVPRGMLCHPPIWVTSPMRARRWRNDRGRGVIVEIVRPGTGDPFPDGEVGEVLVTTLNPDYPLVRFATGDLSAVLAGTILVVAPTCASRVDGARRSERPRSRACSCAPKQVAALVARHADVFPRPRDRRSSRRDGRDDRPAGNASQGATMPHPSWTR